MRRRGGIFLSLTMFMLAMAAAPAWAETTTTFDGTGEVSSWISTVISAGWPVFLAVVGGLLAVTLAAGGVRAIFRKAQSLFVGGSWDDIDRSEYEEHKKWEGYRGDPWGL